MFAWRHGFVPVLARSRWAQKIYDSRDTIKRFAVGTAIRGLASMSPWWPSGGGEAPSFGRRRRVSVVGQPSILAPLRQDLLELAGSKSGRKS